MGMFTLRYGAANAYVDLDLPMAVRFDLKKLGTCPGEKGVREVIPVNKHCPP